MSKKLLPLLILFLMFTAAPACARNETFDIFTYKAPVGYEKDTSKQGIITFTKVKGNKFCIIGIYMSRQSSGNSAQDFDTEWRELVAKPFGIGEGNVVKEDKDSGWDIILKADKAQSEGTGEFYVTLASFSGHGRISSVIVSYNDDSMFQKDIDDFFNHFDTVKDFDKKSGNNTANATTLSSGGSPNLKGGKVTGVWMGMTSGGSSYNIITKKFEYSTVRPEASWRIFFSDGTYSQGMPLKGPFNLNIAQSQQDEKANKPTGSRWGHYTVSGNTISIHHNTITNDKTITILNANELKDHNDTFYKCESVDGLKLDGMWGWTPDMIKPENEDSFTHVIKFSKNGKFTDYGIFAINQDNFTPDDAPGSGTYQLRDFSLILNYDDGRVIQKSFAIYKTVSSAPSVIYINSNPRYKL